MIAFKKKTVVAGIISAVLAGCSAPGAKWEKQQHQLAGIDKTKTQEGVVVSNAPYIARTPTKYREEGPRIDVTLSEVPLKEALKHLVRDAGWSLAWANGADPDHKVSLELRQQPRMRVMQKIALAAGYIAVLDRESRQVTITPKATYTFLLPKGLFDSDSADYSVGNGEGGGSGGSSGAAAFPGSGGDSGGSSSGASTSSFNVSGSAAAESPQRFLQTLNALAGGQDVATITANWQVGMITVTSNAVGLERVRKWISEVVRRAMTQVDVEVAILDVSQAKDNGYGIDWTKVVTKAGKTITYTVATGALVANPVGTINKTSASINTLINLLSSNNNVSIVSRPRILARNNKPAMVFNGTEIPYLGKLGTTVTGGTGNTTQSDAEVSYALDGVSMGVVPSVLGEDQVDLKLVPLLSRVGQFKSFTTNSGTLQAPERYKRQMFLNVVIPDGQTVILGGISSRNAEYLGQSLPGLSKWADLGMGKRDGHSELVMLISTHIVPAPQYQPLIGMSL